MSKYRNHLKITKQLDIRNLKENVRNILLVCLFENAPKNVIKSASNV